MPKLKTSFQLGGERLTDKKQKNVGLFDHYFGVFKADLVASIEAAKGRYGYGTKGEAGYVEKDPNSVPAPSQFWRVDTHEVKEGTSTHVKPKMIKKTVMMADGSKQTFEGERVEVVLDVAGRSIPDVFDKRYRKVKGELVEIKGSDRKAIIPHTMLIKLLQDIEASVADAHRGDGDWGDVIHEIAKEVTDPANRVKGVEAKAEARKRKAYDPEADNWIDTPYGLEMKAKEKKS